MGFWQGVLWTLGILYFVWIHGICFALAKQNVELERKGK